MTKGNCLVVPDLRSVPDILFFLMYRKAATMSNTWYTGSPTNKSHEMLHGVATTAFPTFLTHQPISMG